VKEASGFGWTWESGAMTSTTPIVAEFLSSTGNFRTIGSVTTTSIGIGATPSLTYPLTLQAAARQMG
jgi:hypothetical protein